MKSHIDDFKGIFGWGSKSPLTEIDGIKVIDGKVGGKIPLEDFQEIRKASIHNPDADLLTLGRYMADGKSYITEAKNSNSSYFDLGDNWGEIQKKYNLTDDEMFEYFNIPVLDDAVKNGKEIRFSHKPDLDQHKNSFLASEWDYLKEKYGFTDLIERGGIWYAIK